jgi:hypothetical protein
MDSTWAKVPPEAPAVATAVGVSSRGGARVLEAAQGGAGAGHRRLCVGVCVIALLLGHESVRTTDIHQHATMALKKRALATTAQGRPAARRRYKPLLSALPDKHLTLVAGQPLLPADIDLRLVHPVSDRRLHQIEVPGDLTDERSPRQVKLDDLGPEFLAVDNSGVSSRRGRGFFLATVSILDILSGASPHLVAVRVNHEAPGTGWVKGPPLAYRSRPLKLGAA